MDRFDDAAFDTTRDGFPAPAPVDLEVEIESPPIPLGIEVGLRTTSGNLAPAVEVWTRNSIFELDEHHACVRVIDRARREVVPTHRVIGMQLVGGELQEGTRRVLTSPLPIHGALALFGLPQDRFLRTSPVERVIQWIRVSDAPATHEPVLNPRMHDTPPPVAQAGLGLGVISFRPARGTLAP